MVFVLDYVKKKKLNSFIVVKKILIFVVNFYLICWEKNVRNINFN